MDTARAIMPASRRDVVIVPAREERWKRPVRAGYLPRNETSYRLWNFILALVLCAFLSPLMLIIALALLTTQGRPILYRGPRLGRHRAVFHILKFRTLRPEAGPLTRNAVLPAGSAMETRLGRFLRDSRLDELPQLLNILSGDMNFFGPRPTRPEIAELVSDDLASYGTRFNVKPGLTGYSQALMSHGTAKRIRNRLNARYCNEPACIRQEMLFLYRTGLAVLSTSILLTAESLNRKRRGIMRERRKYRRVRPWRCSVQVIFGSAEDGPLPVIDMDEQAFSFVSPAKLALAEGTVRLACQVRFRAKRRFARCDATFELLERPLPKGHRGFLYLARYKPVSDFQRYTVERYFLNRCVVL